MSCHVPQRGLVYPCCPYCVGGRVVPVQDEPVDDDTLLESMQGKQWLFTGEMCFDCERRINGTFQPLVLP